MRKVISMTMTCFVFLGLTLVSLGPIFTASAAQIVPPIDPGMSDVVAIDVSKGQQTDEASSFIADLQAAGFTVATVDITEGIPSNIMKLIIWTGVAGDHAPELYTAAEGAMLEDWVSNGGELMINGEHSGFIPDFGELTMAFGVTPQYSVLDETDSDWTGPGDVEYHKSWVYYQSDNFAAHPILAGVTEVQFGAGCSFDAPSGAIITTDPDAVYWVFGSFYQGIPNVPVAVALQWGSGRVAIFGDTNWVTDSPIGLTDYNSVNNRMLAMQTIAWLNEEVPPPEEEHDVAAVSQTVVENEVLPGTVVDIDVTVTNLGQFTETFDLTCYYDSVELGTVLVVDLAPGETRVVTFTWDTTGVAMNGYAITAWADSGEAIVEVDEDNNWCTMPTSIFVVPEVPLGTISAALSMFVALIGFVGFKRFRTKQ